MNVLVACEYSGEVRRAFRALGHDAWSCDLLASEDASDHHFQGDVMVAIARPERVNEEFGAAGFSWDMLIAFPPCTNLCVSGARWFAKSAQTVAKRLASTSSLRFRGRTCRELQSRTRLGSCRAFIESRIRSSSLGSSGMVRRKRRAFG